MALMRTETVRKSSRWGRGSSYWSFTDVTPERLLCSSHSKHLATGARYFPMASTATLSTFHGHIETTGHALRSATLISNNVEKFCLTLRQDNVCCPRRRAQSHGGAPNGNRQKEIYQERRRVRVQRGGERDQAVDWCVTYLFMAPP